MNIFCWLFGHSYNYVGVIRDNPRPGDVYDTEKCKRCGKLKPEFRENIWEPKEER